MSIQQNKTDLGDLLRQSREALERTQDAFPPTWDFSDGPAVMDTFPPIKQPDRDRDPLIEWAHADSGVVYTTWLSNNLVRAILRAGVQEGDPCVINRGDKRQIIADDGSRREAWQWVVVGPRGSSTSFGAQLTIAEAARFYTQQGQTTAEKLGLGEPEPELPPPAGDEALPF